MRKEPGGSRTPILFTRPYYGCAGRAADVISAAAAAMEAALRLIRPGRKISDVAGPLGKVGPAHSPAPWPSAWATGRPASHPGLPEGWMPEAG